MRNVLLCSIISAGIALAFVSGAQAGSKAYSERCDNYSSLSYSSKDACLKDGRWHVIYETNAQGSAVYGSVDIVETHMVAGADFKVVAPNQRLFLNGAALSVVANLNEKCQQVYRSQNGIRPIYCLSPMRFGGEATPDINHGSARYGTDGRVYCNAMNAPGGNACTTDPIALKFLIKY
jgi:hypothetical protein